MTDHRIYGTYIGWTLGRVVQSPYNDLRAGLGSIMSRPMNWE